MFIARRVSGSGEAGRPHNWASAAAKVCLIVGGVLAFLSAVAFGSFTHPFMPMTVTGVALVATGGAFFLLSLFVGNGSP